MAAADGSVQDGPGGLRPATAPGPRLSIIVISYNTRDMTLACLRSVVAQTTVPYELIVLDNASQDGSAEAVAAEFPQAILIAEPVNHGFGPAHRIARQHVTTPWILLLNPDTVVLDHALDRLLAFAERTPQAGIWGGRTLHADGTLNPTSCYARMTLWSVFCRVAGLNGLFRRSRLFNSEFYGMWQVDAEAEVDIVTGCLLLIATATWDRLGGFDDLFVMYGEEVDLCLRARAIGLRPRVTPEATIIHYGGASQAVRADKTVRLMRAKMELIQQHFPPGQRRAGLALFRLWPLTRALAGRFSGRGGAWAEVWQRRAEWQRGFASDRGAAD
jgi:GT2 family glycosyltransferase